MLTDIKLTVLQDLALMHQSDAYRRLIHLTQEQGPDYVYKLAATR